MRIATGALLLPLLLSGMGCTTSSARPALHKEATVYFVPFAAETYAAITEATIECASKRVWKVPNTELMALQKAPPVAIEVYDPRRIRAKIVTREKAIFIDSHGIGFDGNGGVWFFDTAQFSNYLMERSFLYSTGNDARECDAHH
jgi:hypothetical protein